MSDDEPDGIAPDEPAPEPDRPVSARPAGRTVRLGLIVLGVIGALSVVLGGSTAADPEDARCTQAKTILEDDGDVEDADDLECEEAIADAIALDAAEPEDEDEVAELASEDTIRTFGLIITGIGVLQLIGALLTLRTRRKGPRLVALAGAALGIVFSPLGIIGIPVLGFVVYAIFFSADARAVFGDPGGPRMFRPRV